VSRRSRQASDLDGFLVVDKEAGMTSHDVVGILRRQLGERRVGHAGTLDPDATGVLVVAVGRATRLMRFVVGADKEYTGTIVLGTSTSSLDSSGEVTGTFEMSHVTLADVQSAAARLVGRGEQIPPMVSAIKIDGKRLYELARAGEEVDRTPRQIEVLRFDVEATDEPNAFGFAVECSSGTYVRSLVDDLGTALGGGAHLKGLRRTRVGAFELGEAKDARRVGREDLRPAVGLVSSLERREVAAEVLEFVLHGRVLDEAVIEATGSGPFVLVDAAGELAAVYERHGNSSVKPILVYPVAPSGGTPAEPTPVSE
jgi:tRNA pseudouridine55 synthase